MTEGEKSKMRTVCFKRVKIFANGFKITFCYFTATSSHQKNLNLARCKHILLSHCCSAKRLQT